ncbi:type II toxin-antitoxin system VapB family antitoxin [Methylobacterium sp. SyP6R]|uniref:type II toxin-antitoxin system VapB family antitoxin n=1 Tax=Methylobacterium sp. SyP6R TaxID=2718876 RepID=UPI001F1F3093|nr:type II toxin-antitoxin system VapB family antitoxin [Methylobacterium sp. SyP6R]MCF4126549.1 type II toxin-antitoxin system VapB family antitoxin [Methylobacterium sp. SyP6R]
MTEPLIIDSDETLLLARRLAERLGTTPGDAVAQALRAYDEMPAAASALLRRRPPLRDQAALVAKILALGAAARAELPPGTNSDHSDLYDEDGLPR